MEIVIKVLQLILALSLLVFVHELGHYLTARMFGIRVEKFYLFFDAGGFSLFKFRVGETTFGLGWVPFGGYCKISGMIDESMDTEAMKQPPQPWEFRSKPAWQRLIVMVGGVVMNVITAIVIYIGMSWHWGDSYIDNSDVKWGYSFNELARGIGFDNGDRVVSVDGVAATGDFSDIFRTILLNEQTTVRVERGGEEMDVVVPEDRKAEILSGGGGSFMTPRLPFVVAAIPPETITTLAAGDSLVALGGVPTIFRDEWTRALTEAAGSIVDVTVMRDSAGVRVPRVLAVPVSVEGKFDVYVNTETDYFPIRTRDYTFGEAIPAGLRRAGEQIGDYWKQLKMIVKPETGAYKQVGSLITIGSIFPGTWNWLSFWSVTAFISIALAVLNILPIPALDGGHVVFLLWEVVTRRRPSDRVLEWAQMVGMFLLLALIVLTFWNDIYRFFIK